MFMDTSTELILRVRHWESGIRTYFIPYKRHKENIHTSEICRTGKMPDLDPAYIRVYTHRVHVYTVYMYKDTV